MKLGNKKAVIQVFLRGGEIVRCEGSKRKNSGVYVDSVCSVGDNVGNSAVRKGEM